MSLDIDYTLDAPVALRARFQVRGFTALLGLSGVGKTSLLRALAGLAPAAGTPWAGVPPERRPIGYLPQETLLFPHLSVLDNTAYGLRGRDRRVRAAVLLEQLGLAELAARLPGELSGGQARRVALARALARNPALLLLDEPTAGLDRLTRDEMLDWLAAQTQARGLHMLVATHDHEVALRAQTLALLAAGRIIQHGPARAVFAAPADAAAAALLGYDNVFARDGALWAIRGTDICADAAGEAFTVLEAMETGRGVRLRCGPDPVLHVELPDGSWAPGATLHLSLTAARQIQN